MNKYNSKSKPPSYSINITFLYFVSRVFDFLYFEDYLLNKKNRMANQIKRIKKDNYEKISYCSST